MSARDFSIGPFKCKEHEFKQILQQFTPLSNIAHAVKIDGPFDGKINSIYAIQINPQNSVIFRTRISKAFRYEPIVKEKILYPLLDKTITKDTPNLHQKIQDLTNKKQGSYIFSNKNPSIVPVQDLLYYYEPHKYTEISSDPRVQEIIPPKTYPYLLTIKNFLPGKSLYDLLKTVPENQKHSLAILSVFEQAGKNLAQLHQINFDAFYDQITDIGCATKPTWPELFKIQWKKNLTDASQYPAFQPLIPSIERFLKDHNKLIENEKEAVIFHNDYQSQNLIITEDPTQDWDSKNKFQLSGIIDFDNWRIGPRAQDFVKMEYWTIQGDQEWLTAFYTGYSQIHKVTTELKSGIALYKLLWFMLVFAFEMDKIKKSETNATVDARFPTAEKYIDQIKLLLSENVQ